MLPSVATAGYNSANYAHNGSGGRYQNHQKVSLIFHPIYEYILKCGVYFCIIYVHVNALRDDFVRLIIS